MKNLCYLNGQILPLSEASIHPLDRGFVFGDAIYEMVKILGGKPLFLAEHLKRLEQSLDAVRIPVPVGLTEAVFGNTSCLRVRIAVDSRTRGRCRPTAVMAAIDDGLRLALAL